VKSKPLRAWNFPYRLIRFCVSTAYMIEWSFLRLALRQVNDAV
jgi:hypothetical protein